MAKTIPDRISGQVFTVEDVGGGEFQSVFPERLADKSAIHGDEQAAWDWIEEVRADDQRAIINHFNRQFA